MYPSDRSCCATEHPIAATRQQLRDHVLDEHGFTLIEMLTVILIIGALAAISLPAFLSSNGKAVDAGAKQLAGNAQTATESLATENSGSYENVSKSELNREDPSIPVTESTTEAYVSAAEGTKTTYSLTTTSTNGDEFTISLNSAGEVTHECVSPIAKTGCDGGEKSTW